MEPGTPCPVLTQHCLEGLGLFQRKLSNHPCVLWPQTPGALPPRDVCRGQGSVKQKGKHLPGNIWGRGDITALLGTLVTASVS